MKIPLRKGQIHQSVGSPWWKNGFGVRTVSLKVAPTDDFVHCSLIQFSRRKKMARKPSRRPKGRAFGNRKVTTYRYRTDGLIRKCSDWTRGVHGWPTRARTCFESTRTTFDKLRTPF